MTMHLSPETARQWVMGLETHEANELQQALPIVRASLADKLGISTGTLEVIRRRRRKEISAWIAERLRAYMVRHLEAEISNAEQEIQKLRSKLAMVVGCAEDICDASIVAAQIAITEARAHLKKAAR